MPAPEAETVQRSSPVHERIHSLCSYIRGHPGEELTLHKLSQVAGLSPFHLQRTFKKVVGVTPREYVEAVRLSAFRQLLKDDASVRSSTYRLGHSSTSWPYGTKGGSVLGMEARAFKKGGAGEVISFATTKCSLGVLLVAGTQRGICFVAITDSLEESREALEHEYPRAVITDGTDRVHSWVRTVADHLDRGDSSELALLPLDIRATAFQWKVWDHLRSIPPGSTESYGEVARSIGAPRAARAVGNACGSNPVAIVIPCHRVVGGDKSLGGYRWGVKRKRAVLTKERAKVAERSS